MLPHSRVFEPYINPIMSLAIETLEKDNEENGVVCTRIILSIHKSFRRSLDNFLVMCVDVMKKLYNNFEQSVHEAFSTNEESIADCVSCKKQTKKRF